MSELFERMFRTACGADDKATSAVTPPSMLVTDPDGLHLPARPHGLPRLWFDTDGPTGRAMIVLWPASSRFARWLLNAGHARRMHGRTGAAVFADCDGESRSLHRVANWAMAFALAIEPQSLGVLAEVVLRYG